MLDRIPVPHYLLNSLIVAAMAVTGNVVGATCAGYALGKLRFRGRGVAPASSSPPCSSRPRRS